MLTVNSEANLTISMKDTGATTSGRIVIAEGVTVTITLKGVSITAPQQTSAIDLLVNSNLTLILFTGTESSLVGGTWDATDATSSGSAAIHVPVGATLYINCSEDSMHICSETSCGKLSVKGEVKSAGIGGNENEECGTGAGTNSGTGSSGTGSSDIAATGQAATNSIKTGDTTPIALYVITLLTAMVGAGLCVIWKLARRRN